MNKKVIESLIKCGAFDSFGATRRQLLDGLDMVLRWAASHAKDDGNQIGLFASAGISVESPEPALPADAGWSDKEMLKAEHEALGFYITAHPLDKYEGDLKRFTSSLTEQLPSRDSGTKVSIGGVIQALSDRLKTGQL